MKKCIIPAVFGLFCLCAAAQSEKPKYRRSSLYTLMVKSAALTNDMDTQGATTGDATTDALREAAKRKGAKTMATADDSIKKSELMYRTFVSIETPDKFDDMTLSERFLDLDAIALSQEEISNAAKNIKGLRNATGAQGVKADLIKVPAAAKKYFNRQNVAAQLVAKWFCYSPEKTNGSHYNLDLVTARGLYSASEAEKAEAQASVRGNIALMDAGKDLIGHTYVIVNALRYRSNADIAAEINTATSAVASALSQKNPLMGMLAKKATSMATSSIAGDGYSVTVSSYLYRLKWNDELMQRFFEEHWEGKTFDDLINAGFCELEFVGMEKARSAVRQSIFSKKSLNSLVKRATTRAIDEAIANLQEKNEDFRTLSEIVEIDKKAGIVKAAIGLKEGVAPGDEYEVLEANEDPDTHVITYKRVGTLKAVKGQIWDNRAGAEEEIEEDLASDNAQVRAKAEEARLVKYTSFKGSVKEGYEGYLIRLLKKK